MVIRTSARSTNNEDALAVVRSARAELALALLKPERLGSISLLRTAQEWIDLREPLPACTLACGERYLEVGEQVRRSEGRGGCTSWVVLCDDDELARLEEHFDRGCVRLVPWPISSETLQARVEESLARGRDRQDLARSITAHAHRLQELSPREVEILDEVRRGRTSKEVAVRLAISKRTVDDHRRSMLRKTGSASIVELVASVGSLRVLRARYEGLARDCPTCPRGEPSPTGVEHAAEPIGGLASLRPSPPPVSPHRPARPAPHTLAAGEWLRALEGHADACCVLDDDDRIQWTNESWEQRARSTERPGTTRSSRHVGRRYLDGIRQPMAERVADALRHVRRTRRPWTWTYPCPTPERRSAATVHVEPLGPLLLVRHTWVLGPQWSPPRPAAGDARPTECMNCRRVRVRSDRFVPSHRIFDAGRDVTWVLCPDCRAGLGDPEYGADSLPGSFAVPGRAT